MRLRVAAGFTLVELLVAMALLSIVMAGLMSALRSFGMTETRIDSRIREADEQRISAQLLRDVLGAVSLKLRPPSVGGVRQIVFTGGASEIRWIGLMPARHGAGGLYHFRLAVGQVDQTSKGKLLLQFAPFVGIEPPSDWGRVEARVLVDHVDELQIAYLDEGLQPPAWLGQWSRPEKLPDRIRLSVRARGRAWAELVIKVYPIAASSDSAAVRARGGGPVIGPF